MSAKVEVKNMSFLFMIFQLVVVLFGELKISFEDGVLSAEEKEQVVEKAKLQFDIENDVLEEIIEEAFEFVLTGFQIGSKIANNAKSKSELLVNVSKVQKVQSARKG